MTYKADAEIKTIPSKTKGRDDVGRPSPDSRGILAKMYANDRFKEGYELNIILS